MVDRRESVARELLRDVRHAIAFAPLHLRGAELRPRAGGIEYVHGAIGDATVELTDGIPIERAPSRGRGLFGDAGQLECLAVVERRVAATVMHAHRMLGAHLVKVATRERARLVMWDPCVVIGRRQAPLFLSSHAFGSQSSTLLSSGSMIQANLPFSCDSGPWMMATPSARSWSSISPRLSTR